MFREIDHDIMTPEEVARYLKKSKSRVHENFQLLGGVKLRGSIFFPRKEELYERIFGKRQGVEVRFHPERTEAHGGLVHHQKTSKGSRVIKAGRVKKSATGISDPDPYNLLGTD